MRGLLDFERWQPIETAPKDGTLLLLIVEQPEVSERSANPIEDEIKYHTIGHNNFENDGEDVWQLAGWNWENDYYTEGRGTPIAWRRYPGYE